MKVNLLRSTGPSGIRRGVAAVGALLVGAGVVVFAGTQANANVDPAAAISPAATGCSVVYTVTNQWNTGYGVDIKVTNLGSAVTSWTIGYANTGTQTLQSGWNGTWTQSGKNVSIASLSWNGTLATNGVADVGANFNYTGTNSAPTSFTLNGVACNGSTPPPTTTTTPPPTSTTPPPTTTTTPPPTTTTGGGGGTGHVANPYVGATAYLSPDYTKEVQAQAAADGGTLGAAEAKIANVPTALWMDQIAAIAGTGGRMGLQAHLDAALAQKQGSTPETFEVVIYDLPGRDCAALASNGELPATAAGMTTYQTQYIDPIAALLGNPKYASLRIVAIIEPDSLPNAVTNQSKPTCAAATPYYEQGVEYALNKLHAIPNVYNYVDAAHSAWLGWSSNLGPGAQEFAKVARATTAGFASIDGFISDTANYTPTIEPFLPNPTLNVGGQPLDSANFYQFNPTFDENTYDGLLYSALVSDGFPSTIGILVDTSRNGWGGPNRPTALNSSPTTPEAYVEANKIDKRAFRGNWCNQNGAGLGARPQANPSGVNSHIIAFVWVKPPGESDGDYPTATHSHGDPHCDSNSTNTDGNGGTYPTGSIPGFDVPAGQWFAAQFQQLVTNAYPPIS